MDLTYLITPFFAWLIAGGIKFIFNFISCRSNAFNLIGYGGLPSNHASIMSSMTALIAIREGINSPSFGAALAFSFIVFLDAVSLRRQIGLHAKIINELIPENIKTPILRERLGHSITEVILGIFIGTCIAFIINEVKFAY